MTSGFDPSAFPDRLNLGCGFDHREGYLNVDLHAWHEPDLVADVTDLSMLPDGRYVEILAQDVLEHLPRTATASTLAEWSRVLAIGGRLHLRIPSVLDLAALIAAPENQGVYQQERFIQSLFGTQAYTGDYHLTTFTRPLLGHYLDEAGLEPRSWTVRDGWLFEIEAEKAREPARSEIDVRYADLVRSDKDAETFLRQAYADLLGREPDPEGLYFFKARLESGEATYRSVVEQLLASPERAGREGV